MHTLISSRKTRLAVIIVLPFVWGLFLFLFMNVTSPLKNGPFSVLVVFAFIYMFVVSALYIFALATNKIVLMLGKNLRLSNRQMYYLVSVIAFGPVFILALNTLGQLDVKEVLLVALLLALGCFYVLRRSRNVVA
jgi:hypothetical protein